MAPDPLAALAQVRTAIARIAEQRHLADREAGLVFVNHAEATRALLDQRGHVERSLAEIRAAETLACASAEQARDAAADPEPYLGTAASLRRQREILEGARQQLAAAAEDSALTAARARELVQQNRARLDASLREQLALLARLEQLEREWTIARARQRYR